MNYKYKSNQREKRKDSCFEPLSDTSNYKVDSDTLENN